MEYVIDKKKRKQKEPEFILLNELAQVFCGLIGGYPEFSDNFDSAKPLNNLEQVRMVQQGTSFKLEIEYIS
jgi:hypothetical protein